jgi:hypothetical protein
VGLPASQQQVLDRIETDLEGGEPRLRSMFAIFARLTSDEGAPRTESLRSGRTLTGRVHAIVAVALILGVMTLSVFMAIGSGRPSCQPGAGVHGATHCSSVREPLSRP